MKKNLETIKIGDKTMKKINFLRILLVVTIALMTLTVVTPAFADGPVYEEVVVDYSATFPSPCGFDIQGHDTGKLNIRIYMTENGIGPKQLTSAPDLKSTWSANGKSLDLHLGGPEHRYMIEPGVQYLSIALGTWGFMTIPGTGHVFGWAGQIQSVVDMTTGEAEVIKMVGNPSAEDWEAICAYLAP